LNHASPIVAKLASSQAILRTDRLVLRPLQQDDALIVQKLAGEKDVASTTRLIPHPYPPGAAEEWIGTLPEQYERAEAITWGVAMQDGPLLGTIRLVLCTSDNNAELGYWIGKPFWNNGYCTEAARAVIAYGFDVLGLERIFANYFARNPASARVLIKLGLQQEGLLRRHRRKFGRYEDLIVCGLLKSEYQKLKRKCTSMASAEDRPTPPVTAKSLLEQ
jgi:RimJ/RimL family protein N-acetyltransferase